MLPTSPRTDLPTCHSTRYTQIFKSLVRKDAANRTQHRETDLVCELAGKAALKVANLGRCETQSPH